MKRTLLGISVLVVVAVGAFFALRDGMPGTSDGTPTPDATGEYQLIVIADAVTIRHPGETTSKPVTQTTVVAQGDRITTSATGRARLSWPNGTITTLETNTDVTIEDLSDGGNHSRITLNLGDIWSKVSRILGSGEYNEIQTKETVAAVRGTLFRMVYRNGRAKVQGIEHTVRVFVRNQDGTTDDSSGTDVTEETQVDVDAALFATPAGKRRLTARKLTAAELRDPVFERIRKERDLDNDKVRSPRPTVSVSPKATSTPTPTPRPSATPAISVSPVVTPTIIPQDGIPPISSLLPLISNLPPSSVTLEYVSPKVTKPGDNFSVNGKNFIEGRNTARVVGVLVGYQPAEFYIIDGFTMFVKAPQVSPGVYEITVTTTEGTVVNLTPGITIQ